MPLLVVCATLLDQRSIFSLLEDVSQADVAKLLSPRPFPVHLRRRAALRHLVFILDT